MKYKYYLLIAFVGALLFTGCYADKGNYDYREINDIVIDTVGFRMKYEVEMYDQLVIDPVVTFTGGTISESDLAYEWHVYQAGQPSSWEIASTEKKLDIPFGMAPGDYKVVVYVTDRRNGITSSMTFDVTVADAVPLEGIVILHGENGETDFDFVATPTFVDMPEDDKKIIRLPNVLEAQGRIMPGNPLAIRQLARNWGPYNGMYVSSDEELFFLDYTTLQVLLASDELFPDHPADIAVANMMNETSASNNRMFFMADGTLREIGGASERPRWDFAIGTPVPVSPLIQGEVGLWPEAVQGTSAFGPICYDNVGMRFVTRSYNNTYSRTLLPFPAQAATNIFDMNDIGKEILFLGMGFNNTYHAMFKDPGLPNYYFYSMNLVAATDTNVPKDKKDMSSLPEIAGAKFFQITTLADMFLYATGRNIYAYDYSGSNTATKINADFPTGEEITMMKLYVSPWPMGLNPTQRVLYIGTWDGTQGRLYEFGFNPAGGYLDEEPLNVLEGFGKITDMSPYYKFNQDPIP